MGSITNIVKRYVPASYRAMVGVTNSYFGLDDLQGLAEFVQYRLYTTVADEGDESTVWDPKQRELLGMLSTLQFIPAAIDYWGDQLSSQATSGTNEDVTYFDRRNDLWKVYDRIAADAEKLGLELGVNLYTVKAIIPKVSQGDNGRKILDTSDPRDWGRAFTSRGDSSGIFDIPWNPAT